MGAKRGPMKATLPIMVELLTIIEKRNVPTKEFSVACGYAESTINSWRNNRWRPSITTVVDVAAALGYDLVLVKRSAADA